MSKITIVYFSGTGNTAWVVQQLAERLTELGDAVQSFSCEEIAPQDAALTDCDALGVAFPVHASWAPKSFRPFLAQLPPVKGRPLFVIACAAYFGGDATWYAARPLAARGYAPFLYANVFMPNNLYPVPGPEQVARIAKKASRKIDKLAPLIHQRRRHIEGVHPLGWLGGYTQRWSFAPLERMMQRYLFADDTCNRCGWCVEHCPVGNIELTEDSVRFLGNCTFCARCFHQCPQQAIQFTNATRNESRFRRYPGPNRRYRPPRHKGRRVRTEPGE